VDSITSTVGNLWVHDLYTHQRQPAAHYNSCHRTHSRCSFSSASCKGAGGCFAAGEPADDTHHAAYVAGPCAGAHPAAPQDTSAAPGSCSSMEYASRCMHDISHASVTPPVSSETRRPAHDKPRNIPSMRMSNLPGATNSSLLSAPVLTAWPDGNCRRRANTSPNVLRQTHAGLTHHQDLTHCSHRTFCAAACKAAGMHSWQ
jgi:hypothetical protein